jgi:peroxiredoxin
MDSPLQGEQAPDFELVAADGTRTALRDLRGAPVVLAFYPADWSPVCGDQMTLCESTRSMGDSGCSPRNSTHAVFAHG